MSPFFRETPLGPAWIYDEPAPGGPTYPQITRAQWAVLVAMTDQRCNNMMEAMDFVSDLSPEAKEFLRGLSKEKVEQLKAHAQFYEDGKRIWRFGWIAAGSLLAFILGVAQIWKIFGEYVSITFKSTK